MKAVIYVDGCARVQTIIEKDIPQLYELLNASKGIRIFGELRNTYLNGAGFINCTSDWVKCAAERG